MDRTRLAGFIRRPSAEEIRDLLESEYIRPTGDELEDLRVMVDDMLTLFDSLDDLSPPELPVRYPDRKRATALGTLSDVDVEHTTENDVDLNLSVSGSVIP